MIFYHSWLYRSILNTEWFMWTMVYLVLGGNLLAPIVAWFYAVMRRRRKTKRETHARMPHRTS
ncbi:hypothetical protein COLU111180_08210 [Cohnella lubricantis]|uniref:Uncharacterized protein n=1 Tax=Cohnella lubricantis TaxID=2163172 RepID=A0A841TGT1_9BACL|nr:hypothetical protein [Cohnella lubricantis]MBB6677661.1 hypothetical protein [Cohnella lubricantis]MBP2117622.1 hypothetical protein [Cohnella lubricantis]